MELQFLVHFCRSKSNCILGARRTSTSRRSPVVEAGCEQPEVTKEQVFLFVIFIQFSSLCVIKLGTFMLENISSSGGKHVEFVSIDQCKKMEARTKHLFH